jgi:hypothetical protein
MKAFVVAAVTALGGAAIALPWENIVSAQTAGVIGIVLGGAIAIVKALYTDAPATPAE